MKLTVEHPGLEGPIELGSVLIEGDSDELEGLRDAVNEALEAGEGSGWLLSDHGVSDLTVRLV